MQIHGFTKDCTEKRAMYIERNCEINQEFYHAHPEVKCRINKIYNSSFPGSILWDFTSEKFSQFVNSWSVSVRHMWDLPYATHKYFMEPLGGQHALSMIITIYIKFKISKDCCPVSGGKGSQKLQHTYWTKCEICPGQNQS